MRRLGSHGRKLPVISGAFRKLGVALPALAAGIALSLLWDQPKRDATPSPPESQAIQALASAVPGAPAYGRESESKPPPAAAGDHAISQSGLSVVPSTPNWAPLVDARRTIAVERLTAQVSGSVVAYGSGKPIPHATVRLTEQSDQGAEKRTNTDSRGNFSFSVAPDALFDLRASAEGFKSADLSRLRASGVGDGVVLKLSPLLVVRGRVVDPGGAPVAEATVAALREGKRVGWTKSDSRGRFRLDRINAPGRYDLWAAHPEYRLKAPAWAEVPSGSEVKIVMEATPPEQMTRIGGTVMDDLGNPVAGAEVDLIVSEKSFGIDVFGTVQVAYSDSSGDYEFSRVRPGGYSLTCGAEGFAAPQSERQKWLEAGPGGAWHRVDFRLWPESTLTGLVTNEEGTPVARARVLARPEEGSGQGTLSDQEGRFTLRDLAPVAHRVTVEHGEYVKFQTTVTEASERDLRVVLRRGVSLTGVAYGADRRPLEKFALRFVRTSDGTVEKISRHTSPDGAFQVRGLEGGEYQLTLGLEGDRLFAAAITLSADSRVALIAPEAAEGGLLVRTLP